MKSFLRDLTFLGLFAATVAALVLLVAVHQGRFSPEPDSPPDPEPPRAVAAMPMAIAPVKPPATVVVSESRSIRPWEEAAASPPVVSPAPFDPATRGVLGDARVLCLPEVSWLQQQLSSWSRERTQHRRSPPTTLDAAHAAARRASAFTYQVSPECWNDPATVEDRGWGDCADKSLWLARELLHAGYPMVGIRLGVPEDYTPGQPGHAWVVLYHHGGEWIYDPAVGPRLTSQDAGLAKRFRVTATIFPRHAANR
jgi:hypothetical protein